MRRALISTAFLLLAGAATAQRLPDTVVPEHYALWFAPDLQNATFRGRASIDVALRTAGREIILHAAELQFSEVTVSAGGRAQPARVTLDARREMATLVVPQSLPAGPATIRLTYTGILNDKLRGFYLSKANGRNYAVSQMEATDARRAFPSFDEPAYKATFDIALMVDNGDTAISNGAQISDTPGPDTGKHTVTFARTAKMSSYLVAMLVGDFVCREGSATGTPIRVCSTPDKLPLTGFALEAAQQQLAFYNRYFGIPYPFGKLDIIAVPDFAAGAMENTGAITFRERLLIADPERASLRVRKNIAAVISHEIAHQWFGDLVTMKWWDDIWLNEGFATWAANKPLAEWRPDWQVQLDGVEDTLTAAATDSLRTTRPVRMDVETPDQINEVFDAIAYEKASGVLRMVEAYVGPEEFRKSVTSYLRRHSNGNAAAEDFWNEVTRVTAKPVDRVMRSYIDQAGIPVLTVRSRCVNGSTSVDVRQERFSGTLASPRQASQLWAIPVCLQPSGGGAPRCELVEKREQTLTVQGCSTGASPLVNPDNRGYFFTEYQPDAVRTLAREQTLSPSDRLALVGNEWWMIRSGRHDIGVFMDVAGILATDSTSAVTEQLRQRLTFVSDYLVPAPQQPAFALWVREQFAPALDRLGIPGDPKDADERQARRAALLMLVGVTGGADDVRRRARELALRYIDDPTSLPGTLAQAVLQVAATSGDAALYEHYLAEIKKPALDPDDYYRFFGALSWFRDPALVQRTIELALSPEVRTQDTGTLLGALLARPWSRDTTWEAIKAQWQPLTERLGTFQGIPSVVQGLQGFCSTEKAADVKRFFAANPTKAAERTLQQSLERIESCAAVADRQRPALANWLSASPAAPSR